MGLQRSISSRLVDLQRNLLSLTQGTMKAPPGREPTIKKRRHIGFGTEGEKMLKRGEHGPGEISYFRKEEANQSTQSTKRLKKEMMMKRRRDGKKDLV